MNITDQIRAAQIPFALRAVVAALIFSTISVTAYLFFAGLIDARRDFWIAAGASLLASAPPMIAIAFLVIVLNVGTRSLQLRTGTILERLFPRVLAMAFEPDAPPLHDHRKRTRPTNRKLASVRVGRFADECWANYEITDPGGLHTVRMRLEANVRTLNLNVVFPDAALVAAGVAPASLPTQFAQTLGGAAKAGYSIDTEPFTREDVADVSHALVLRRAVDSRFLWDAEEQLFIAQDIMLMVRAMVSERPNLFPA